MPIVRPRTIQAQRSCMEWQTTLESDNYHKGQSQWHYGFFIALGKIQSWRTWEVDCSNFQGKTSLMSKLSFYSQRCYSVGVKCWSLCCIIFSRHVKSNCIWGGFFEYLKLAFDWRRRQFQWEIYWVNFSVFMRWETPNADKDWEWVRRHFTPSTSQHYRL